MKKQIFKKFKKQKGSALILTILVMALGLIVVLSMAGLVIPELKMTRDIENSDRAFYAAESGVERSLNKIKDDMLDNVGIDLPAGVGVGGYYLNPLTVTMEPNLTYTLKITNLGYQAGDAAGTIRLEIISTGISGTGAGSVARALKVKSPEVKVN